MIKSPSEGIEMATETRGKQGKSENQKLKTYIVMQYLLRNTDERHPATMEDFAVISKNAGSNRNAAAFTGTSRIS